MALRHNSGSQSDFRRSLTCILRRVVLRSNSGNNAWDRHRRNEFVQRFAMHESRPYADFHSTLKTIDEENLQAEEFLSFGIYSICQFDIYCSVVEIDQIK